MRVRGPVVVEFFAAVVIIGVFLVISLSLYRFVSMKTHDTKRMDTITQLQKSLVLYSVSKSHFPVATTSVALTGDDMVNAALVAEGALEVPLTDPDTVPPLYSTNETGTTYRIQFCLSTDTVPNYAKGCDNIVTP